MGEASVHADGMVTFHGYTLMDFLEIQGFKLLKIRNTWGNTEWSGDWGDASSCWTEHPDIAKQLNFSGIEDDGIFWMTYADFVIHFCGVEHCGRQEGVSSHSL